MDELGDDVFTCRTSASGPRTSSRVENGDLKTERPDSTPGSCENGRATQETPSGSERDRTSTQEADHTINSHLEQSSDMKFLKPPFSNHQSMTDLESYGRRAYRAKSSDSHSQSPTYGHSAFLGRVGLSPPYYDSAEAHTVPHYRVLDSCSRSRSCDFAQSVLLTNYPFRPGQPRSVSPRPVMQSEPEDLSVRSRSDSSASSATSRDTRLSFTDSEAVKPRSPM